MRFRLSLWRRKLLKVNQEKLKKLKKKSKFNDLLIKLSKGSLVLLKTRNYCANLAVELQSEMTNHYGKRTEYFQVVVNLAMRQVTPNPDLPSEISILNDFQDAINRADIYCKKVTEGLELRLDEFEKLRDLAQLGLDEAIRRKARKYPVRLQMKMEQALIKAEEIKSELDNLKSEWDGVKDELNSGIDDCIQQVNILLQDAIARELGPGEE